MPTFEARVRTTHNEVWVVEAADEAEARILFEDAGDAVGMGDPGQEIVDWEVKRIKLVVGFDE